MARFYFRENDDERCYLKKDILEDMKENGPDELKIFEAEMIIGEGYFWCSMYQEAGEVGQGCGRVCPEYKPRNGKNGRCRFSTNCYEPTGKNIILNVK